MTGIIHLKSGTYAFRTDHHHGNKVWAWEIHGPDFSYLALENNTGDNSNGFGNYALQNNAGDNSNGYDKSMTHKWDKLPKGHVELFDIEQPPQTVTYIPIML